MSRKYLSLFVILILVSMVALTSELCAFQEAGNSNAGTSALVTQLQAQLEAVKLEQQTLEAEAIENGTKADELTHEIDSMQDQHFARGISGESFAEIVRTLQTQRVQLMIDLAGLEARLKAVQEYGSAKNENPLYLEVINKMQEQVEILKGFNEIAKQLHDEGRSDMKSYREAQHALLAAEIQLRQTQLANGVSPEKTSDEFRAIALERAEKKARLSKSQEILQGLADVPGEFNDVDRLKNQRQMTMERQLILDNRIKSLQSRHNTTKHQIDELLSNQAEDN